ncbi:ectopic P granules protein 5 homolog [Chrysoperla carnea]|uniref:ectopic P granules protein 5 homolog n=1 Tax=Chrysoperla carnea TaxID=189513 RepID=UPI001D05F4A5|nr:ectopic P granules protein 5 homolog [Chrysoperla carnea]
MEVPKIKQNKKKEKKQKQKTERKPICHEEESTSLNVNIESEIQEAIQDTPSCSKNENVQTPKLPVNEENKLDILVNEESNQSVPVNEENIQNVATSENILNDSKDNILIPENNETESNQAGNSQTDSLNMLTKNEESQQTLQNEPNQICPDEQISNNITLPKQSTDLKMKPILTEEKHDTVVALKNLSLNQTKDSIRYQICNVPSKELIENSNQQMKMKPFTSIQLCELYHNEEYDLATTHFIREFIDTELSANFDKQHNLYHCLMSYYQVKQKSIQYNLEIQNLIQKCSTDEGKLWIVNETKVSKTSECSNKHSVSVVQNYTLASFQNSLFKELTTSLLQIKQRLHDDYELNLYLCQTYKLQVDYRIQCITDECRGVAKLSPKSPVQLQEGALPLYLLQEIRICLSILFYFQRRNISEKSFIDETRKWIEQLVAILLRVASWKDHLFLLHHILRCPGGIANWATHFIQAPCPKTLSSSPFSDAYINHVVTTIAIILSPIEKREAFLSEFLARDMVNDSMWIVVDSDGEDEENESVNTCPIRESDLIALLNQIPLGNLFRNLTRVITKDDQDILNLDEITESYLLQLIAWSSKWIEILGCGIRTYSTGRYRQLIKLLSRFINYTIQYVTEVWILFSAHNTRRIRDEALIQRLQIEYDALFLRATKSIYSSQRLGAWQFLAVLPFETLSSPTLWIVYYLLHNSDAEIETMTEDLNKNDIIKDLNSASFKMQFEEIVKKLPDAEIYYLLQTFANMALSRTQKDDWDFIQLATINLLHVGFTSVSTRENNSKHVRDLLSNLTVKHPILISTILKCLHEHISHMGQLALYLFKELPLHLWVPTEEDFQLLAQELTNRPIISFENNLVRFILAHLNWDFRENSKNDELFLPQQIHLRIALLLVTATTKHYADGMAKGTDVCMIWESWVWKFLLRLRLHLFDQDSRTIYYYFNDPVVVLQNIPEYHPDILQALKDKQHVATFVTLLTTQCGHSVPLICDHGFVLMQNLINSTRYNEVIFALHLIIPIFLSCEEALWHCDKLKDVIIGLFNADKGYVKMAKNLIIANDPGPIIKQFGNMIQYHLNNDKKYFLENPGKLISIWLRIVTSIEGWNRDSNYIYIVDIILRSAFFCAPIYTEVFDILRELLKVHNDSTKTQTSNSSGGISSLFSWMSTSATMPTLLLTISENSVWLGYFLLELEYIEFEYKTGVWKELFTQIRNSTSTKTNIDNSLKKAAEICKTPFFGSKFLSIYRWSQQALEASFDHPILILLWQKFFALYFYRNIEMNRDLGGIGNKFFEGVINLNYLKKIKKRLQDTVEYFSKKAEEFPSRREYFINCESLFKTFLLWFEETRLQEPGFNIHSLPPTYLPQKLLSLFEQSNELWFEYVNYEHVKNSTNLCSEEWITNCYRNQITRIVSPIKKCYNQEDHLKHLLNRLNSYDNPQPPPELSPISTIIPPFAPNIFVDKMKLMSLLKPRVNTVIKFTQNHSMLFSQHTALDCGYGELLPQLYKSELRTIRMKQRCANNGCSEVVNITFMNTESKLNESILHQIRSNRSEYEVILKRCLSNFPPDFCNACLYILQANNLLVSEFIKASSNNDNEKIENIQRVAADSFYYIISVFSDEIKFYSPARFLFSSITTRLGETFITGWDTETTRLLNIAIQFPKLIDTLVSLFEPPVDGVGFLNGYKFLVDHITNLPPETTFLFLSKFDIKKWLGVKKPRLCERSEILSTLMQALMALGLKPEEQFNLLHELLRSHLISVFCHEWPEHYGEVLQAVLRASSTSEPDGGCISVLVWKDLLNTLGYKQLPSQSYVEELRHYATTQTLLKYNELLESAVLLGHHFTQERLTYGLYGLYPRFRPYVEQITTLLAMFGHGLVVSVMHKYPGLLADELLEMIWPGLTDMFSPWLMPYWTRSLKDTSAVWIQQLTDGRAAVLPWIYADINYAQKVISAFVNIIRFIIEMLPASNSIFNRVWQYYISNFAHSAVKDHVLSPIHSSLLTLPWERFWPSLQDLEIMLKVVDQYLPTCHIFIGCIAMRIPWVQWLNAIENNDTPTAITIRTQQCLLPLLVKLSHEPAVQQQSLKHLQTLLSQAFRFNWYHVDVATYETLINWYVMSVDPKVVLRLNDKSHKLDYLILDVLLASAEHIPSGIGGKLGVHAQAKRKIFIRSFTRLLIATANRYKNLVNSENIKFRTTVVEVLEDMENILKTNAVNETNKFTEVTELLEEFLIISDDKNLSLLFNETLTEWLSSRTEYNLVLHGVLSVLGTVPQCLTATGAILDAALLGYFNLSEPKWEMVVKLLKGRNLWTSRKLLEVMAQNGNILAFHSIMLIRKDDQTISLPELIEWITQIKPDKNIESRLPLIWNDVLELIITDYHKTSETNDEKCIANILTNLKKFTSYLNKIADEKSGWGNSLLGAMRIRNNSVEITNRCRFFCKALALFLNAQIIENHSGNEIIRCCGESIQSENLNTTDVKSLHQFSHGELKVCADITIKQIQDLKNSLHNSKDITTFLCQQLYNERFL